MLDQSILKEIASELFVPQIYEAYGPQGTSELTAIMDFLPQLFERISLELLRGRIVVFRALPTSGIIPRPTENPVAHRTLQQLAPDVRGGAVIEVHSSGEYRLWHPPTLDEVSLSQACIVYQYENYQECFIIRGAPKRIKNPNPIQPSLFARPTFGSLKEALLHYKQRIRTCSCTIFSDSWLDPNRLFFKTYAEKIMRLSLHQHLQTSMRDAEVRPEQIVDETHPADLKVTWHFTTRLALIEIKWLGKSRDGDHITAEYYDARAKEGAKQLAEYLDSNRSQTPYHQTRGYLVVVDGRRRGLNERSTTVNRRDGFFYEVKEIEFDPQYHVVREDFEEPLRMFVEPICAPVL
jgi:hypothetical protein